jgi:alpha-tubulin suppressor-like RCC1 family protein
MTTNFQINGVDWDDKFVRRDIFTEGGVWGWGDNTLGQSGDGGNTSRSSPVQLLGSGGTWKIIGTGGYHTAGIRSDGTLWTWGYNSHGQIGDSTITMRSSPVQTVAGGTNWKQSSGGVYHTAAVKTDGTLWLWGRNNFGQLGINSSGDANPRSSPVQTLPGGSNWKLVSCGVNHTSAVKTDGTLWLWGWNYAGQLGDGTPTDKSSPVQTISQGNNWKNVGCGVNHTSAVKTDGTLWLWGWNVSGPLGDGTETYRSSPVQTVAGGTNWKQSAAGYYHTLAIKTDGTLWTWGLNTGGVLGTGDINSRSSPAQTISGGSNWKQVTCTYYGSAAIKTDGTLWLWGLNTAGLLGDNTIIHRSSPVQTITGGTNWKQIDSGSYSVNGIREDYYR